MLMNISPHLLIDAVILSSALSITFVLRAKGNAARKKKDINWLLRKTKKINDTLWLEKLINQLVKKKREFDYEYF